MPSGSGWTLSDETDYFSGAGYTIRFADTAYLKVAATVNPGLAASGITASGATLTLSDYDLAWWYQGSQSDAACQSAGTAATASLANLPTGASYTYTAYSDSSCATALDSVTFSTPADGGQPERNDPRIVQQRGRLQEQQRQPALGQRLHHGQRGRRLHPARRHVRVRGHHGFAPPGFMPKSTPMPAVCRVRWSRTSAARTPRPPATRPGTAPAPAARCRPTPPTTSPWKPTPPAPRPAITMTGKLPLPPTRPTRRPAPAGPWRTTGPYKTNQGAWTALRR